MKNIKNNVQRLSVYSVPQGGCPIKLNQNESPFDVPADLKEEIVGRLAREPWNRYPQNHPVELLEAIAEYTGRPSAEILAGNSANEMIQSIFLAAGWPADRLVVATPGFSIYPRQAAVLGMKIDAVPLRENFRFDIPRLAESVRKARLVFLASPNNPTGTVLERADVEILARNCRGLLVIDEAYFEFHKQSVMDMLERYDNLIVLRTFSKAFSLAGVRIGYLAASEKLALAFNKTKLPFSLSAFQQVAGTVLLKNIGRIEPFLQRIIEERERVFAALRLVAGVQTVPSAANFFMFKTDGRPATEVYEALRQRGVLVRCFGTSDTAEWLRVSIGLPEENDAFLASLRAIVEN